jgi:HlyD family secretion protein
LSLSGKIGAAIAGLALVSASAVLYVSYRDEKPVHAHQIHSRKADEVLFAAPGRIEGLSDTIAVGAAADGVLKSVYVTENEVVKKGTMLGEVACDDLDAALRTAFAEADAARQARTRLLRGARKEERQVAAKKTAAAKATLLEAKAQLVRQTALFKGGEISRADYDRTNRDFGVANAEFQTALRSERLIDSPPLPEDKARAEAEVLAAESRVQEAQERLKKCAILAPIDGTVLRVDAKPGEPFSTVTPHTLFFLADASGRRVKAEIDERDVSRVAVGQKVVVQAEGLGGEKFAGTVESVSSVMGRKSVFSDDPADKLDRQVLETTINLASQDANVLPIGLRVTVQFLSDSRE